MVYWLFVVCIFLDTAIKVQNYSLLPNHFICFPFESRLNKSNDGDYDHVHDPEGEGIASLLLLAGFYAEYGRGR